MSSDDDGEHQDHFRGKRHREQSILGIFGDQDSDHDETASKQSASAAIRGRPLASKPVSFISTGPTVPADAVQNAARQPVQSADIRKAAVPIEKVDKDFAAFEKAGSGFGSRMLEKMGWVKGRAIGKNGQGVVNPIEARLRPNSMGLGFGGYHETTAKAKQQQSRILHSGDQDVAVESENSGDEYGSRQNMELAPPTSKQQHWKKHEKRELKVTSAAELRAQWAGGVESKSDAAATAGSMKVVDMRGPQTRVHSSVQNALSAGAQLTMGLEGKGGLVPELHHNVRMSVEVAEANLDLKHRELRNERQTLATLTKRRDSLAAEVRVAAAQLQESAALAHAVTEAAAVTDAEIKRARSTSMIELDTATRPESYSEGEGSHMIDWGGTRVPFSAASSALINAANKWYDVRKAHPEGFIAWELDDVAASMVAETLRRMFRHWRPLAHPSLGIAVVQSWRRALGSNLSGVAGVSLVGKAYAALIHLAIMPALRGALTNEWEPRSSEIAITVLSAWQQLIPDVLWRELFARQVLPRLASELSSWEFKADPTPPHLWLHPWLPLLPSPGLAALLPTLRHKLANSLAGIGVETPKAVELLYPWRTVLDLASWQGLVSRHVLPHLEHCLTTKLTINPAEQDVQPFIRVLSWTKVLSIEELSGLLLRHFFPVWLRTLERWVEQRPNFNELSCWYMGWKTLLQDQAAALLENEAIRAQLNHALALLNAAVVLGAGSHIPMPTPPSSMPLRPPIRPSGTFASIPQPCSSSGIAGESSHEFMQKLSLRALLEQVASENGLVFMPTNARYQDKLIFSFGKVPVYVGPRQIADLCSDGSNGRFPSNNHSAPAKCSTKVNDCTHRYMRGSRYTVSPNCGRLLSRSATLVVFLASSRMGGMRRRIRSLWLFMHDTRVEAGA